MLSPQIEFPLFESLSAEGKLDWLKAGQDAAIDSQDRVRRKVFSRLGEIEKENRELKLLLTQLVDLIHKSQS